MTSRITKFAVAAVIIIALTLSVNLLTKPVPRASSIIPTASAAQVLTEAMEAASNLRSVHIKARMRTDPYDNFASIDTECSLIPVELWKQVDSNNITRWRFEKKRWRFGRPGRVMVTEGEDFESSSTSVLLIGGKTACKWKGPGGSVGMLIHLLDVDKVLDSEIKRAREEGSKLVLTNETGAKGRNKLVVTIDANAQGDFTNDWLKNKYITASNNRRIYRFDAKTKLLEALKIYIYPEKSKEVLVFEIKDIEYNIDIDPKLFEIKIPKGAIWHYQPEVLPDNEKYERMSPKEAAAAFFEGCSREDWNEVMKFWPVSAVDEGLKSYSGLEIISIGEPFKSGDYPGWFVPYEIRLKGGYVKKWNLAVRNDNPAKRWVVDGGF
jgi:outer membrane lipoprotein-sorting protein